MINKLPTLTFQIEIYKFESKSDQIWNAHENYIQALNDPEIAFYGDFLGAKRNLVIAIFSELKEKSL